MRRVFFFFNDTATTEIYTLSLHDALPICRRATSPGKGLRDGSEWRVRARDTRSFPSRLDGESPAYQDRKSTRLKSSHVRISYAVFCLKKKNNPPATHSGANQVQIVFRGAG